MIYKLWCQLLMIPIKLAIMEILEILEKLKKYRIPQALCVSIADVALQKIFPLF